MSPTNVSHEFDAVNYLSITEEVFGSRDQRAGDCMSRLSAIDAHICRHQILSTVF